MEVTLPLAELYCFAKEVRPLGHVSSVTEVARAPPLRRDNVEVVEVPGPVAEARALCATGRFG